MQNRTQLLQPVLDYEQSTNKGIEQTQMSGPPPRREKGKQSHAPQRFAEPQQHILPGLPEAVCVTF